MTMPSRRPKNHVSHSDLPPHTFGKDATTRDNFPPINFRVADTIPSGCVAPVAQLVLFHNYNTAGSARRSTYAHASRSKFVSVALSGDVPSWEQLNRCRHRGLGEREEQLFLETWRGKNFLSSGASASKSGLTRRRPASRNSRDVASATLIFSSQAIASRTRSLLTLFSARSSVEERRAMLPIARTEPSCFCGVDGCQGCECFVVAGGANIAVGDEPASCELKGSFASSGTSQRTPERKITASPCRSIACMGTDRAASASASRPSYYLAQVDPAAFKGANGDDRSQAPPAFQSLSESNQRQDQSAGWPKAPVRLRSVPIDWVASRRGRRGAVCARGEKPRATICPAVARNDRRAA